MQNMAESRNLSVSIERDVSNAYAFLSVPANFPKWASGLGSLHKSGNEWIADTPKGPMQIRFSEPNSLGVLDHWVSPKADEIIYIPMRVVRNGQGTELIFTLFRLPNMSNEQFDADARWVLRDLQSLKRILEER